MGADRESIPSHGVTVQVDFADPSRFLDVNPEGMDAAKGQEVVLNKVRDVFRTEAQKRLPYGYSMIVQVKDIDLAGDYEPWRDPEDQARIDREIYPPRIEFEYEIIDDSGNVLSTGSEYLNNLFYLLDPAGAKHRNSEVAYDVSMLIREWMKGPLYRKISEHAS